MERDDNTPAVSNLLDCLNSQLSTTVSLVIGNQLGVYCIRNVPHIATLPCSRLFYVEGSYRMDLPAWIKLHQDTFEYIRGILKILVPDNLKTGVTKHTLKENISNKAYVQMTTYYQTVIMPTRVRLPRDKASVEGAINIVTTWIIQAFRNVKCFTLEELIEEIWENMDALNHRPFQNRPVSRWSAFLEEEKFASSQHF